MRLPWNSSFRRRSKSTRRDPSSASPAGCSIRVRPIRGLPQDWGYGCQQGISRVCGLTRSGRVSWILRLLKTGAEGEGQATDVMEIDRPDDVGDIATLGLTLSEAKQLLA